MIFGFCHLSIVPIRKNPSDTSEMVSQLLFGEVFEVLEKVSENWILIKNAFDHYEGYIDPKQQIEIDSIDYIALQEVKFVNPEMDTLISSFGNQIIPPASHLFEDTLRIKNQEFTYKGKWIDIENAKHEDILHHAKAYLNAPYLWGGKTPFGVDCSGFTQSVYKMSGIKLPRDASEQAKLGETLNFIEEVKAGDLAFFDNEEGNIIHVGIMISANEIIHASGRVRIDQIDHQGIFNKDFGKYTHQLRLLKTFR